MQETSSFVAVVEAGSFIRAAESTGLSKAAVSRHVGDLEKRLAVRLLQRTTRRLSLTEEGRMLFERAKELLESIDEAESELTRRAGEARGVIRVNAPLTFGALHLAPLWGPFVDANPKVSLDITLSDRVIDVVDGGYDLAMRITRIPDSTLVTRKLESTRMVLCVSPTYLERHGTPAHPSELASHAVISYSYWATRDEWHFTGPEGGVSVKIRARIHTSNGDTCRRAAFAHHGVILQPDFIVGGDRGWNLRGLPQPEASAVEDPPPDRLSGRLASSACVECVRRRSRRGSLVEGVAKFMDKLISGSASNSTSEADANDRVEPLNC